MLLLSSSPAVAPRIAMGRHERGVSVNNGVAWHACGDEGDGTAPRRSGDKAELLLSAGPGRPSRSTLP